MDRAEMVKQEGSSKVPLNPMIVIGCGGSGGKVVLSLRRRLEEELRRRGWSEDIPASFQMKWVDVPDKQESFPDFGQPFAKDDYVGLALHDVYEEIDKRVMGSAGRARAERLPGWRPSPYTQLPVLKGAGQMRAIGRAVALSNAQEVSGVIESAVQNARSSQAELVSLSDCLGAAGAGDEPIVFVVSSLAGGTGAGIFQDVCDLIRSRYPDLGGRIISILLTAEIFPDVANDEGIAPNSLAASSELMNAMLEVQRGLEPLYGLGSDRDVSQGAGPSVAYLVGLRTLDESRSLRSSGDAYRVISESLLALMLDEHLQQAVFGYDLTNRNTAQRSSKFRMLQEPSYVGHVALCGFVSSFGAAKVSVGSGRFGVWARDRMVRSVLEYLLTGWRDRGLELVDPSRRSVIQDPEIVRHIVDRDREEFFDQCGLWEEDEPDGTRHDQVLNGIMSLDDLKALLQAFHQSILTEMKSFGQLNEGEWKSRIPVLIRNRESDFRGRVSAALEEGSVEFAAGVVERLQSAVSNWLAEFGQPVTLGLAEGLSQQCRSAVEQLEREARDSDSASQRSPVRAIAAAFQSLSSGRVDAVSSFVEDAVRKGVGPNWHWARRERFERAASLLSAVVDRILNPLVSELRDVGEELSKFAADPEMNDWPAGSGVPPRYVPPPSEFCLVGADEWSSVYERLLSESEAGSIEAARDRICAGGFEYGDAAARKTAPTALRIGGGKAWLGPRGRQAKIDIDLRPQDLKLRAECFLFDPSTSIGRFIESGLNEYLSESDRGDRNIDHSDRLRRFREALASATQMASPLFRIDQAMMSRLHTDGDLKTMLTIQELPFDVDHPAYSIAEAILLDGGDASQAKEIELKSRAMKGVESVLFLRRLAKPVHPAVVASLYKPIVSSWDKIVIADKSEGSIRPYWNNKRARLLQEFVPVTPPAMRSLVRGWFVGRLLGLITDPTKISGFQIHSRNEYDKVEIAAFPWPLLHHGWTKDLHDIRFKHQWLPALLEHLPLAMMMLSQDEHSLDSYERMYQLGQEAVSEVRAFVKDGPTSLPNPPQVLGDTEDTRKTEFKEAVSMIRNEYVKLDQDTSARLSGDYLAFSEIPFGWELFPIILEELDDIHRTVDAMHKETRYG